MKKEMTHEELLNHLGEQVEGQNIVSITAACAMLIKMCADEGGPEFKEVTIGMLRHVLDDLEARVIVHEG